MHCETIEKQRKILLSVRNGSEKAYQELYEQWVSRLYGFVFQYLKSKDATDDVVQETFLRIWSNRANLNPDVSFKSYLFTLFAIDMINDKLRGDIEIENKKLDMWFQDSIHWDGMLFELDYIKLILIELLERKIIDNPKNNIDSRDFK